MRRRQRVQCVQRAQCVQRPVWVERRGSYLDAGSSAFSSAHGASALGGMLLGTLFGVLVVPGLYFIFASLSRRNKLVEGESGTSITEGVSARRARLEKILEEDEAKERAAAMTSAHDAGAEQDGDEDHHAVAAAKEDGTLATSHVEEQEEDEREGVDGTTETRDETEDADNEEGEGERDE